MSFGVFDSFTLSTVSFFSAYLLIPSEYIPAFCTGKWQVIKLVMEFYRCFNIAFDEEPILVECLE